MHRIDSSGHVDNKFQPGNPAIGQIATLIAADWLNAIQEAICRVIELANIDLEKGNDAQLYDAIIALIAGVVGDGSGAVPTTRQVATSGLAGGGGDLAGDRTIDVPVASQAEVAALTINNKAVTPLALAGLVGLTITGSAWIIKIGSVVLQIFNGTTTNFTLPQAYTTQCRGAWVNGGNPSGGQQDNGPYASGFGLTTVSAWNSIDSSIPVIIFAIGV